MYKEMGFDSTVTQDRTGNEKEKNDEFEITGLFMIDYGAFMNCCYGDMKEVEIPKGKIEDILMDLVNKKRAWENEAAELDPENNEAKTEELLKKIDAANKMIEHYSQNN